jgi:hypothetical protein
MIRAGFTEDELRLAAANLLRAYQAREKTLEGTQARLVAEAKLARLLELGARAGFADTAAELEVVVADAVEQLAPAGTTAPIGGGLDWTWLMQARFILARRLDRVWPAVAA